MSETMSERPRVAINGFGRIGRSVFRILAMRRDVDVVAINDLSEPETLAYLCRYDTVHGPFPGPVSLTDGCLSAGSQKSRVLGVADPGLAPWRGLDVDIVVEATGRFRTRDEIARHLEAGAERVILTVPARDEIDATIVIGVNDETLRPEHRIVSNASCTTNCLAPVVDVLHRELGIKRGWMTTVHAYTNDQRLADVAHRDLRRSRAANDNIIPTTTGAARAVGRVLPELEGKLDGIAMRVPVADGSIVDLVAEVERDATVEGIHRAMRVASTGPRLSSVLEYTEEPIVSSDVIQNPHSAIFDASGTRVLDRRLIKVLAWYDNEWAYANRVVDLAVRLARIGSPVSEPVCV